MPWLRLTWVLLYVYAVLTCLVLFHRADFINLTVCSCALFMLYNTETLTRNRFRLLVLGIILTLFYDLFWFIMKHSEYSEDSKGENVSENRVKRFSLFMSYISFFVRVRVKMLTPCVVADGNRVLERLDGLQQDHPEQG